MSSRILHNDSEMIVVDKKAVHFISSEIREVVIHTVVIRINA